MKAIRETDTFDTFLSHHGIFCATAIPLRQTFLKEDIDYWLPVDQYVRSGIEHAILHLLYSRFFTKALEDLEYINIDEPFKGTFHPRNGYTRRLKTKRVSGLNQVILLKAKTAILIKIMKK